MMLQFLVCSLIYCSTFFMQMLCLFFYIINDTNLFVRACRIYVYNIPILIIFTANYSTENTIIILILVIFHIIFFSVC